MAIEHRFENQICILEIKAPIRSRQVEQLLHEVLVYLETEPVRGVIVNLHRLRFLGAAGVRFLRRLILHLRTRGLKMALTTPSELLNGFGMIAIRKLVVWSQSEAEAIASLKNSFYRLS